MNGVLNLEYCIYLQFTFIVQLFSCQMFLTPDSIKRREHFGWFLALKIIVDIFVSFIAYLILFFFGSNFWSMLLTYTGMFLFSSLSYLFIFDADFKDAIYITTIGYVFQHIAYKTNFLAFDMHTKSVFKTMHTKECILLILLKQKWLHMKPWQLLDGIYYSSF